MLGYHKYTEIVHSETLRLSRLQARSIANYCVEYKHVVGHSPLSLADLIATPNSEYLRREEVIRDVVTTWDPLVLFDQGTNDRDACIWILPANERSQRWIVGDLTELEQREARKPSPNAKVLWKHGWKLP